MSNEELLTVQNMSEKDKQEIWEWAQGIYRLYASKQRTEDFIGWEYEHPTIPPDEDLVKAYKNWLNEDLTELLQLMDDYGLRENGNINNEY